VVPLHQTGIVAARKRAGQFKQGIRVIAPGKPRCTMRRKRATQTVRMRTTGIMEGYDGALSKMRYAGPARREILHHVRLSIPWRRERR
jgi:hypothetical protein